jgi:hypothetical protein
MRESRECDAIIAIVGDDAPDRVPDWPRRHPGLRAGDEAGAVEFLTERLDEQKLFAAIHEAIERDRRTRRHHAEPRESGERYESLTAVRAGAIASRSLATDR